ADHIRDLERLGAEAAIIGQALYTGDLSVRSHLHERGHWQTGPYGPLRAMAVQVAPPLVLRYTPFAMPAYAVAPSGATSSVHTRKRPEGRPAFAGAHFARAHVAPPSRDRYMAPTSLRISVRRRASPAKAMTAKSPRLKFLTFRARCQASIQRAPP